jgi:hypothetical protein
MQEFPAIRFRAAKPTGDDMALEARALVAQRVAIEIHDRLIALQKAGVASNEGNEPAQGCNNITSVPVKARVLLPLDAGFIRSGCR